MNPIFALQLLLRESLCNYALPKRILKHNPALFDQCMDIWAYNLIQRRPIKDQMRYQIMYEDYLRLESECEAPLSSEMHNINTVTENYLKCRLIDDLDNDFSPEQITNICGNVTNQEALRKHFPGICRNPIESNSWDQPLMSCDLPADILYMMSRNAFNKCVGVWKKQNLPVTDIPTRAPGRPLDPSCPSSLALAQLGLMLSSNATQQNEFIRCMKERYDYVPQLSAKEKSDLCRKLREIPSPKHTSLRPPNGFICW